MKTSIFLLVISCFYGRAIAQEEDPATRLFHYYKGYSLSAGMPYLTKDELYKRTDGSPNLGFSVAFTLGSTLPSGRSIFFEPAVTLSLIQRTTFERPELRPADNSIIRYHRYIDRANTIYLVLPFSMMTNTEKKVSFGGGLFTSIPITGNGRLMRHTQQWAIIFPPPPTSNIDKNYRPAGVELGYTASIQLGIKPTKGGHQRYIRVSYMHDITERRPSFTQMNAVMLVVGTRKVTVREKRERWDTF